MSSHRGFARGGPQRRRRPRLWALLVSILCLVFTWPRAALAEPKKGSDAAGDVDSEHLFGFTEGSDIGERGERELEADSTGRFGRQGGQYAAVATAFEAKYTPTDYFRFGASATVAGYAITGVPGFDDRQQLTFQELAVDFRYRLFDRDKYPLGLTFAVEPHQGFVDEASGAPADRRGARFSVLLDKELVAKRLYAALNLSYEPEETRLRGASQSEREAMLAASAAVAVAVRPDLFWGAELRYLRRYDGFALDAFAGEAIYGGPTLYAKLWQGWWLSAAWNLQLAGGRPGIPGSLDLVDFDRHQMKFRLGRSF